jgi:hypothetical protein
MAFSRWYQFGRINYWRWPTGRELPVCFSYRRSLLQCIEINCRSEAKMAAQAKLAEIYPRFRKLNFAINFKNTQYATPAQLPANLRQLLLLRTTTGG